MTDHKDADLSEGGAKQTDKSAIDGKSKNPALQKENRQAVKNQSAVDPEDYPDAGENPV